MRYYRCFNNQSKGVVSLLNDMTHVTLPMRTNDHDDDVQYDQCHTSYGEAFRITLDWGKGDKTKSIIIIKENVSNINAALKSGELPHLVIFNETNYIVGDSVNIQCRDSSAGASLQLIAL
ncbi:uncharacterized protein [Amphiura filiformis]|uniref:uncharacterized protein n=1 Tax=Amphiura filiformis TaxID=82378 RepID=UPI003B220561